MIYKATIDVFVDVEEESEAADAIAETLREILQRNEPMSSLIDWHYNKFHSHIAPATFKEIEELEQ